MTRQDVIDLPGRYRLRVEDYRLLDNAGAFVDFAKTELIDGEIIAVQSQYSPHARVQTRLLLALSVACERIGNIVEPWAELSVAIGPETETQPDIVVARCLPESGPITPAQVAILVEVADSSLKNDLIAKAPIYAAAGIPEYWVADVNARLIYQMWAPQGEQYNATREVNFGIPIEAATVSKLIVASWGLQPTN